MIKLLQRHRMLAFGLDALISVRPLAAHEVEALGVRPNLLSLWSFEPGVILPLYISAVVYILGLAWSGLAAGLSMGLSLVTQGCIKAALPAANWSPLISTIGYSVGFVVVILGRQQLFTENTLTPILPLMEHRDIRTLRNVLRLWAIVLATNLLGAAIVAFAVAKTPCVTEETRDACLAVAREAFSPTVATIVCRGIVAGWIIALLVWLQPFAAEGRFWVILLLTYTIGIGKFSHGIAGSIDAYVLASAGEVSWWEAIGHFTLPALLGNIIGGVALVAAVNHAQAVGHRH